MKGFQHSWAQNRNIAHLIPLSRISEQTGLSLTDSGGTQRFATVRRKLPTIKAPPWRNERYQMETGQWKFFYLSGWDFFHEKALFLTQNILNIQAFSMSSSERKAKIFHRKIPRNSYRPVEGRFSSLLGFPPAQVEIFLRWKMLKERKNPAENGENIMESKQ